SAKLGSSSTHYLSRSGNLNSIRSVNLGSKNGIYGSSRNASLTSVHGGQTSGQTKLSQVKRQQLNSNQVTRNVQGVGPTKAIQNIKQVVEPNAVQQAALDELKDASTKAVDVLLSGCPTVLLSTPVGRVAAMHQRLETMLQAVGIVQAPLQKFYESLSDEQKAQ